MRTDAKRNLPAKYAKGREMKKKSSSSFRVLSRVSRAISFPSTSRAACISVSESVSPLVIDPTSYRIGEHHPGAAPALSEFAHFLFVPQPAVYNMAMRPCPACHSSNRKDIGEKNSFQINLCSDCATLYSSEPFSYEYDGYYSEHNLSIPETIQRRVKEIVATFEPYRKSGALLDIGFGAGTILDVASTWNRYGVEVSASAIKHAKPEWKAFHGTLEDAHYPDNFFDVVTASEIIEHCPDPQILLTEVYRILRPGGLFWGTTPAANGLSFRLLGLKWSVMAPPEHLQLFSSKGMKRLLKETGFSRFNIAMHGFNPSELFTPKTGDERVASGYQLNEQLTSTPGRTRIKSAINFGLNITRLGDSLKIRAVK